ncbi:MAG: enoyl-CoA hydratase/isomerase family protein [Deltaproteobacteria bacterium]|nr:enoyl-CoA hydratase/isomerase family protein [Deltaproteobacteria bacterium]
MGSDMVHVERDGAIAICHLDRPPANAVDIAFVDRMAEMFERVLAKDDVGAVVLTGKGAFFSGGLDLKAVPAYGPEEQRALIEKVNAMVTRIYGFPRPVVAAVNGHAVAAGLILMLTADYRVGTDAPCKIGLTEARVGIPFPAGPMEVLKAEVTPHVARVLALEARNIGPAAALEKGLLDELQPPGRVLPRALEVARDLAGIPSEAYRRIKRQLRGDTLARMEAIVAERSDPMLEAWIPPGAAEASAAVLRGTGGGG